MAWLFVLKQWDMCSYDDARSLVRQFTQLGMGIISLWSHGDQGNRYTWETNHYLDVFVFTLLEILLENFDIVIGDIVIGIKCGRR